MQISNIIFPTLKGPAVYGKFGYDDSDSGNGAFYKKIIKYPTSENIKFSYQKHAIIKKDGKDIPFLDKEILANYSSKFKKALDYISTANGTVLLNSRFIKAGILPFALMLEQNGFIRYCIDGETQLLDGPKSRPICYKCGKHNTKDEKQHLDPTRKDYHKFITAKYIMVTGSSDKDMNIVKIDTHQAVTKFSSKSNMNGEEIKVFLGSSVIKEGLDFKHIRQMYIMDPWFNISDHEQKIGRAIRFCSHVNLPEDQRNVEIFQLSTTNDNAKTEKERLTETVDERNYRYAETKDKKIKEVRNVLKKSAIDCIQYKKRNIFNDNKKVKQITSTGNEIEVTLGDKPYSVECDYKEKCDYECVWEPTGKVKIDTNTYDLIFDKADIEKAEKRINELYKTGIVFEISKIKEFIKEKYPSLEDRFIYKALENFLKNKKQYIKDRYNRIGYLIYRGDYYIFQPLDLTYEKIPIYYRGKPYLRKPKYIRILEDEIDELGNINEENKENDVNVTIFINESINNIQDNFVLFDELKKYDSTSGKKSYKKSIIGLVLDKFELKYYLLFIKQVIKFYLDEKTKENNEIIKLIIDYLDPYLIKYGREIDNNSEVEVKDNIYGFRMDGNYFRYNKNLNKWSNCTKKIIYRINNYEEYLQDKMKKEDSKKKKNNIIGILTKNRKRDIIFQIINYSKSSNIVTQNNKKSKRTELTGRTCTTIATKNLMEMRNLLKLDEYKKKKPRKFICNEMEIVLRIYSYNNKDNKIWLINKNILLQK